MRKIHVLTQKELIDSERIRFCTAVVIDVLLATSTITTLLDKGCAAVFAVKDSLAALEIGKRQISPHILMGEWNGKAIENFHYPDPSLIDTTMKDRVGIICSTNGTIAIEKAKQAKILYASSLINGHCVAEQMIQQQDDSSIVLVCSGNGGRFSLEDFIGAGQLVEYLLRKEDFQPSDAARLAKEAFLRAKEKGFESLYESETAELLRRTGFNHTVQWVIDHVEKLDVVPVYRDERMCAISI